MREQIIVYWPGMSRDIHDTVAKCSICLTHRHNNQKEPMIPHAIPDRSWQKLGSDVFQEHKGKPYLVVVDYYSKFIETSLMRDKTKGTIVTHMKSIFARHGSLKSLYQTTCHTTARNSNTLQVTGDSNSPPQVPLILKRMVSVRKLYRPSSEFLRRQVHCPYIGLLEFRNTPVTGMTYSPSQLLMSRVTKTKIPVITELLQPKLVTEVYQQLKACQQRQVHHYNQGTKPLTTLELQEDVRLRQGKTWTPAIVDAKAETPRPYLVTTATGQQYH